MTTTTNIKRACTFEWCNDHLGRDEHVAGLSRCIVHRHLFPSGVTVFHILEWDESGALIDQIRGIDASDIECVEDMSTEQAYAAVIDLCKAAGLLVEVGGRLG